MKNRASAVVQVIRDRRAARALQAEARDLELASKRIGEIFGFTEEEQPTHIVAATTSSEDA